MAGSRAFDPGLPRAVAVRLGDARQSGDRHLPQRTAAERSPPYIHPAIALFHSPKLAAHIGSSLWRVFAGYGAAVVSGVILGFAIGRSRAASDVLLPPLELLRPIPAVAWIPLSILMFPSSELSMVFITFIGALFPIVLNTVHGVANVDRRLVASARSLGARRLGDPQRSGPTGCRAEHRHRPRDRHGYVLVLPGYRGDDLRPIRHRLLHLGGVHAPELCRYHRRHAGHRPARHGLQLAVDDGRTASDALVARMGVRDEISGDETRCCGSGSK